MTPRGQSSQIDGLRRKSQGRRTLPLEIVFAGNHGLEISGSGLNFEHAEARRLRPLIASAYEALTEVLNEWPAAWIEDKGLTATPHFRSIAQHHRRALLFAARCSLAHFGQCLALVLGIELSKLAPEFHGTRGKHCAVFEQTRDRSTLAYASVTSGRTSQCFAPTRRARTSGSAKVWEVLLPIT